MDRTARQPKRKVAVVYHYLPHYRAAVFESLAAVEGFDVEFYADTKNLEYKGVPPWQPTPGVHRFTIAPTSRIGSAFLWQKKIIPLAFRRDLDTVIFLGSSYYLATWIAAALCRMSGKRVLFWTIGWRRQDTPLKTFFRTRFYRLAHALLLYGYFAKAQAIRLGFQPKNLHVVFNSLNYPRQLALRERVTDAERKEIRQKLFPNDPERPILICTTRLVRKRQLDDLLRAVGKLRDSGHHCNVLLVGDGEEREKLERITRELQLPVHFYGACYDEEVLARLIMTADATVAPGMVGLTAMQSLAYGTPVITHDNPYEQSPEFESIVPGFNGDLFKHGDLDSLAEAIRRWTSRPKSRELERKCYQMIDRFYNPRVQTHLIVRAIEGALADDVELAQWTRAWLESVEQCSEQPGEVVSDAR